MTTVASGAHAHPEVGAMQDLMAQMVDRQTEMMSAITTLAEGQVRLQEAITTLAENQARMQESILELQAATGDLARVLAVVQADVALLVARDS